MGKRGPKAKPLDPEKTDLLKKLCLIQCTDDEIQMILDFTDHELEKHRAIITKERQKGKMSIKRKMFQLGVEQGHPAVLSFLFKFYCARDYPKEQMYIDDLGTPKRITMEVDPLWKEIEEINKDKEAWLKSRSLQSSPSAPQPSPSQSAGVSYNLKSQE